MVAGIYLITNKETGQKYVGGSIDIENRINEHKRAKNLNQQYIEKAINKYGWDKFNWQIITKLPADWKTIGQHEKYWINFYNTFEDPKHYNLTEGGEGISGWKHTKEAKEKVSKANSGRIPSKETRDKMSESRKGEKNGMWRKKHTPEARKKMSENSWIKKDYPRIVKGGFGKRGKQVYKILYNGKKIMESVYKKKLFKRWYDKYPDIELIDETE